MNKQFDEMLSSALPFINTMNNQKKESNLKYLKKFIKSLYGDEYDKTEIINLGLNTSVFLIKIGQFKIKILLDFNYSDNIFHELFENDKKVTYGNITKEKLNLLIKSLY